MAALPWEQRRDGVYGDIYSDGANTPQIGAQNAPVVGQAARRSVPRVAPPPMPTLPYAQAGAQPYKAPVPAVGAARRSDRAPDQYDPTQGVLDQVRGPVSGIVSGAAAAPWSVVPAAARRSSQPFAPTSLDNVARNRAIDGITAKPAPVADPAFERVAAKPSFAGYNQGVARRSVRSVQDNEDHSRGMSLRGLNPMSQEAELMRRLEISQGSFKGSPAARRAASEAIAGQMSALNEASLGAQRRGDDAVAQGAAGEMDANEAFAARRMKADTFNAAGAEGRVDRAWDRQKFGSELELKSRQAKGVENYYRMLREDAQAQRADDEYGLKRRGVRDKDDNERVDGLVRLLLKANPDMDPSEAMSTARQQLATDYAVTNQQLTTTPAQLGAVAAADSISGKLGKDRNWLTKAYYGDNPFSSDAIPNKLAYPYDELKIEPVGYDAPATWASRLIPFYTADQSQITGPGDTPGTRVKKTYSDEAEAKKDLTEAKRVAAMRRLLPQS